MSDLKSQTIYRALRERILSNDIDPGARLVLRDIAQQYQASDIPVREALRMLERDGLVETAPYRGARVTTLTTREVEETYFIRSHLESLARRAALMPTDDPRRGHYAVLTRALVRLLDVSPVGIHGGSSVQTSEPKAKKGYIPPGS